jgi:hypothetical protein
MGTVSIQGSIGLESSTAFSICRARFRTKRKVNVLNLSTFQIKQKIKSRWTLEPKSLLFLQSCYTDMALPLREKLQHQIAAANGWLHDWDILLRSFGK